MMPRTTLESHVHSPASAMISHPVQQTFCRLDSRVVVGLTLSGTTSSSRTPSCVFDQRKENRRKIWVYASWKAIYICPMTGGSSVLPPLLLCFGLCCVVARLGLRPHLYSANMASRRVIGCAFSYGEICLRQRVVIYFCG